MRFFLLFSIVMLTPSFTAYAQLGAAENQSIDESQLMTIDELVISVREGTATQRAELAAREQRFIDARANRADLLQEAIRLRQEQEAEADRLRLSYQQGEEELAEMEDQLQETSGDLNEVFSIVSQISGDALPMIQNSLVSSQFPDRILFLEKLAGNEATPAADELRELWLLLLDEMNQSGQIARFEMPIITAGGEEEVRQVTRIGTFSALSDGEYLRFLPESGRLLALARQPVAASTDNTLAFENAESELMSVALDPSRGTILSLIVQTPELSERIQQGGLIGYIILFLGGIGLILGGQRLIVVVFAGRKAKRALSSDSSNDGLAINQLRQVATNADYLADVDAMSAKMDEIITTWAQQLRRGLSTLAIFAAVSPLLGLLGTVTGMIETFQVITLFGAGDPRLMSGGISQALITTQLGLAVAIPLLLIHSFIQGRTNSLITDLDETAADLFAKARVGNVNRVS